MQGELGANASTLTKRRRALIGAEQVRVPFKLLSPLLSSPDQQGTRLDRLYWANSAIRSRRTPFIFVIYITQRTPYSPPHLHRCIDLLDASRHIAAR